MSEVIPDAAVEAAAEILHAPYDYLEAFADAPSHRRERFRKQARELLEAAAPIMLGHEREEIGYLCGRGHFVFHDEPDSAECGSKRTAGVYVERDPDVEFYGPYETADEEGFVYASGSGYSEDDYAEELAEARNSLTRKIEEWRNQ